MPRLFLAIAFVLLFLAWVLYRLLIKKDLKQNLNTLFLGLFFIGVWALIYWYLLER